MNALQAKERFEKFMAQRSSPEVSKDPAWGLDAMFAFYRECRATDCDVNSDADMLLFQWGTYHWSKNELFEFDITRQLILGAGEDDQIWQLSLTFLFPITPDLKALKSGNRWCHTPNDLEEFAKSVRASQAFKLAATQQDAKMELDFECAG
jgi:hypothetical protein